MSTSDIPQASLKKFEEMGFQTQKFIQAYQKVPDKTNDIHF